MDRKERYTQLLEEIEHPRELSELAQKVDIAKSTVRKYLGELVKKGRVKRKGKGLYRRTEAGSDWLSRQEGTNQLQETEPVSGDLNWDQLVPYPNQYYPNPTPAFSFSPTEWLEENPGKLEMVSGLGLVGTGVYFLNKQDNLPGAVFTGLGLLTGVDGFSRMLRNRVEEEPTTQERELEELETLEEEDPL